MPTGWRSWASEPDQGQGQAVNKGLRRTTGDLVAWLNSDDVLLPGAVAAGSGGRREVPTGGDGVRRWDDGRILSCGCWIHTATVLCPPWILLSFEVLLQPTVFMRRKALEQAGWLNEQYHLILDHELWVRISARYPLQHVPSFWALERTHAEAKTIHQAADFVEEAQRLIDWAAASEEFGELVHARRQADSVRLPRLLRPPAHRRRPSWRGGRSPGPGAGAAPGTVARYWYKVVQAVLSALGLEGLFLWYRNTRRRIRYRGRRIELPYRLLRRCRPAGGLMRRIVPQECMALTANNSRW